MAVAFVGVERCNSTMTLANEMWEPAMGPTWFYTETQTHGRGRRGRAWLGDGSMMAATLVFSPDCSLHDAALRSFVMALAVRDVAIGFAPGAECRLKWPNDVLLEGGKLSGILLEAKGRTHAEALLIGVGVNVGAAPTLPDATFPPVGLSAFAECHVDRLEVLSALARQYAAREAQLNRDGFAGVREEWLAHAARLGEVIRVTTGRDTLEGTFETIDAQGNLLLRTYEGVREISAGDVFF